MWCSKCLGQEIGQPAGAGEASCDPVRDRLEATRVPVTGESRKGACVKDCSVVMPLFCIEDRLRYNASQVPTVAGSDEPGPRPILAGHSHNRRSCEHVFCAFSHKSDECLKKDAEF